MLKSTFWFTFIFAILGLPAAYAQVETAKIVGTVKDSTDALVPGVQITLIHVQTNRRFSTITNDQGRYVSVPLPVGEYRVEAELPGFKKAARSGITLQVQDTAVVDFTLEVGEVTELVEVKADAPLLNSSEPSQGQVIDNRRMVDMPLNGRDYIQLALLSVGAVEPIGGRAGGFSSGGQRTTQNNYLLDGVDNNSVELATAGRRAEMVKPSIDAIQEFKVQTNSYSAEFGHGTGAVINVTTKSGSNEFHGTVFEFLRNEVLDARNFFDTPGSRKPPFKRNQFGFSLGGPIIKNKTFFFGDYEGTRIRESRTVLSAIPTLKMRNGDFSEIGTIFDPASYDPKTKARQPFSNNLIPANRIDPIARILVGLYPTPQNNSLVNNFTFNPPSIEDVDKFDIRIDHAFSNNDNVYYRFSFHDQTLPASLNLPAPAFGGAVFDSTIRGVNTGLVWNHSFSSALITSNRAAWNFARFTRVNPAEAGKENLNAKYGLKGVDLTTPGALSQLAISGYRNLGLGSFNGVDRDSQNSQFSSDTTWIRGNQTFKFGANIIRSQNNIYNIRDFVGNFTFNGRFTNNPATGSGGDALADFMLGIPSRFVRSTPIDVNLRGWLHGFYLQSDWQVSRGLTLNLGMRYELSLPYIDQQNQMAQFDMDTDPFNPKLVPAKSGGTRADRALIAADTNNFAPRIGFAYQLAPLTVVRGGYGTFYGYMEPSGDAEYLIGNPPFAFGSQINTDSITPALLLKDGAPPDLLTVEKATSLSFSSFERNPTRDYSQQWNLNIQRQLGQDWLFEIGYFGDKGTHLLRRIFGNPSAPGAGNINAKRRYKSIAIPGTNVVVSPLGPVLRHEWSGNSIFHSLQTKVEKRFSSGFTLLSSYIWSKTIGDTCGFAGSGNAPGCDYQDPQNLRLDRGLDNQHLGHRFVLSSIWELPFGNGRRLGANWSGPLDVILGGWSIGDIITIESGQPLSPTVLGDPANTGENNRPNLIGGALLDRGKRTVDQWFNRAAFVSNERFMFGNAGRNILLQPGVANIDFATYKRFRIREGISTQFRFEAFNFFNTPHFGAPNAQFGNRNFGRITSAGRPRTLQFGLKVVF